ncbi:anthrone oxygenase family protein [Mycolicibacterium frederiksbergense]|nr:anthrone oxygenase family protein [Mycolicibacterium frederiksbergense]
MTNNPVVVLTAAAAIASATAGGIYYAFSTFVMNGLNRVGPVDAITAMRGINTEATANAPFMVMFFGSALLALAVGVVALTQIGRPGSWYLLAGAIFGVLGVIVTMLFNVPLNDHLKRVEMTDAAAQWQAYFTNWTAWNHVRAGSGLAAATLMLIGLGYR